MIKPQVHSILAVVWLFVIAVLSIVIAGKEVKFSSSIFLLLPESDQSVLIRHAGDQISKDFSKRLVLLLSGPDEAHVRNTVEILTEKLSAIEDTAEVFWRIDEAAASGINEALFDYRFAVLTPETRARLLDADYATISEQALRRIYSLLSIGQNSILDDPFALYSPTRWVAEGRLNYEISNSLLKVTGVEQPTYLMLLKLVGEPFEPDVQRRILDIIQGVESDPDITIEKSGMLLHAAAGARQASAEISTIGLGSIVGIIVLVLVVFRRIKPLGLMFIPISVGYFVAAIVTSLVFEEVHLVTLAFGAGLVGVSIDYALHFLCERRVLLSHQILPRLLPGLMLGLFSSVMAYAAQALAPFPGLRQMAVFSVTGLIAAWLTVVLWFPWLTRKQSIQPLVLAQKFALLRQKFPVLPVSKVSVSVCSVLILLAVMTLYSAAGIDDVRLLQTSPRSLVVEDQKVSNALGVPSSTQFILVRSKALEASLQKEEQLIPYLEALKRAGLLSGFQAISSVLPSLNRQDENLGMVSALYGYRLHDLLAQLKLADEKIEDAFNSFDVLQAHRLTPEAWNELEISTQWKNFIVSSDKGDIASLIRLSGLKSGQGREQLMALIDADADLLFVDQIQNNTDLLTRFRIEISRWVALAFLLIFSVLVFRYKQQVWRIVLPPLMASILTLALLVQIEQGINLFHIMALILVLGIGLDMGIFLAETDGSSHTWLAVSLSCVTSLMAFGLLALSKTPVLHHFGITVLLGLSLVWLLVIAMRAGQNDEAKI